LILEIGRASIHFMNLSIGHLLEGPIQIEPPDRECPHDGDRMECLGWQVGLPSIVLTPFTGAHYLLGIGHRGGLAEALSKCVSDQGSRCGLVSTDPAMDILQ
jgi:hypothetical protein